MSVAIIPTDNGTKIGENIVFNPLTVIPGIINLQAEVGEEMAYDRENLLSINFPGEYDIGGYLINVYLGTNEKLNYLIVKEEEKVWIIQSPDVLELDEVCDMNIWVFSDETLEKKLDQLEMEGERINLNQLSL